MGKTSKTAYLSDPDLTDKDILKRSNHGGRSKQMEGDHTFRPTPMVVAPDGGYGWYII